MPQPRVVLFMKFEANQLGLPDIYALQIQQQRNSVGDVALRKQFLKNNNNKWLGSYIKLTMESFEDPFIEENVNASQECLNFGTHVLGSTAPFVLLGCHPQMGIK